MSKWFSILLQPFVLVLLHPQPASSQLLVTSDVPGLAASNWYAVRIRQPNQAWQNSFVFWTMSNCLYEMRPDGVINNGCFDAVYNYSGSWVSYEVGDTTTVEVEIEKLWGDGQISLAIPRPASRASASLVNGKTMVAIVGPQQVNIDIDGQFERVDSGNGMMFADRVYPRHTISIFANPYIDDTQRPDPNDPDVRTVAPGETAPGPGEYNETTLYFLPGVHNLYEPPECCSNRSAAEPCICSVKEGETGYTRPYLLQSFKRYYVPTGAWLNGNFYSLGDDNPARHEGIEDMQLFGYGSVAGSKFYWKSNGNFDLPNGIKLRGAKNCSVVGLTFVDFMNHNIMISGGIYVNPNRVGMHPWDPETRRNTLTHVKVFGWKTNCDGVHVFGHWNPITDLFLRTSDDSCYVGDEMSQTTFRRITTWNDVNGVPFIFGKKNGGPTIVEDCDIIYHRKQWPYWCGGLFDLRWWNRERNFATANVTLRNIRITDPHPTCPMLDFRGSANNIAFENITIDAHPPPLTLPNWACDASYNNPNMRFGVDNSLGCTLPFGAPNRIIGRVQYGEADPIINISNLVFDHVTVNGTHIRLLMEASEYAGAFVVEGSVYHLTFYPGRDPGVKHRFRMQERQCFVNPASGRSHCISLPEGYSPNSTKVQRLLRNVYELAGDKDEL